MEGRNQAQKIFIEILLPLQIRSNQNILAKPNKVISQEF